MHAVAAQSWPLEATATPWDDHWLSHELDRIWDSFFRDIPRVNVVNVSFARHWKARLGLIMLSPETGDTHIRINAILRFPEVPDYVRTATLAHELVHYAHGFGSPLPRKHTYPHRGGVVRKELTDRGLGQEYARHLQWIREHWDEFWASRRSLRLLR
jgi:hypothetical protein